VLSVRVLRDPARSTIEDRPGSVVYCLAGVDVDEGSVQSVCAADL
jgi:hypothetical protein